MMSDQKVFDMVKASVKLLAAPPAEQEHWLAENHFPVDELALQLDDDIPACLPRLMQANLISPTTEEILRALDEALTSFSGPVNAALWTEEALYDAEQWQYVRELARRALAQMGNANLKADSD
jgi:hypothetical protein